MIPYILHAGLILAGCFSFYKILLQKETFYQLNRFVLLACLVLSFSLPLLPIPSQWSFRKAEEPVMITLPEQISYSNTSTRQQLKQPQELATVEQVKAEPVINFERVLSWLMWLYWFGVGAFSLNLLIQVATLLTRVYCYPVIKDGPFTIVELPGNKAPCSFGNIIFINPEKYDWETYNQIMLHEKIHIQQQHTIDILLAEIVLIFQWFNPFAWLYRKELENNLEFLTDDLMLSHGEVDKTNYQMNLLKVSAPHFPLSLTTNYNQSLLKKRVLMMNAKKSNVNTTWKYLFLFPLLIASVCLLNKPIAYGQAVSGKDNQKNKSADVKGHGIETEGLWFATIKNDKVSMQFKNDDDDRNSMNGSTFPLSEFRDLPREKSGTFSLTREAGTLQFSGKFEGDQGMGRYKFTSNKEYGDYMRKEGIDITEERDLMTFFMVDVTKSYVQMLKANGYTSLGKNDLIPLAALHVDEAYIKSLKDAGFHAISLHDLIPLKSLGVNGEYIKEIRDAGYPNVSVNQLITFKAQGIDGKYIAAIRSASKKEVKEKPEIKERPEIEIKEKPEIEGAPAVKPNIKGTKAVVDIDAEPSIADIVAIKALDVNPEYIRSLKEVGYGDLSNRNLVAMKAQGITADYIKGLQAMGYKDLSANEIIGIKVQNITKDYIKGFEAVGFTNIPVQQIVSVKALGITPEYIKSFNDAGYKNISLHEFMGLKAQGITPALIKEYKSLGFENISIQEVVAAKATGTSPAFIKGVKEKGYNLKSLNKYIQLKTTVEE